MTSVRVAVSVAAAVVFAASSALAGAPLKGVDVKLGKNPGGSPAARTTDGQGRADFGVLPAGQYSVLVGGRKSVHLAVSGVPGGSAERVLGGAAARAAPFVIEASGREPVVVTVSEP